MNRKHAQGQCTFHGMVVVPLKEDGLVEPAQLRLGGGEGEGRAVEDKTCTVTLLSHTQRTRRERERACAHTPAVT